mmetsp:Transcript_6095/g.22310  ORF Transcript_6095/g.22310 Transcript_6095/m.22310 type:complete len:242 (-) Transcript_6095:1162-1887(-)
MGRGLVRVGIEPVPGGLLRHLRLQRHRHLPSVAVHLLLPRPRGEEHARSAHRTRDEVPDGVLRHDPERTRHQQVLQRHGDDRHHPPGHHHPILGLHRVHLHDARRGVRRNGLVHARDPADRVHVRLHPALLHPRVPRAAAHRVHLAVAHLQRPRRSRQRRRDDSILRRGETFHLDERRARATQRGRVRHAEARQRLARNSAPVPRDAHRRVHRVPRDSRQPRGDGVRGRRRFMFGVRVGRD